MRRQVERRDRGRCVVPGCRSSRYLQIHHIQGRAHGGRHEARNLTLVCTRHHRCAHEGRLVIRGQAPALTFHDAEGRPYGTPDAAAIPDAAAEARRGLETLGFSKAEAAAAVQGAVAHVGQSARLETLMREALRRCRKPASG